MKYIFFVLLVFSLTVLKSQEVYNNFIFVFSDNSQLNEDGGFIETESTDRIHIQGNPGIKVKINVNTGEEIQKSEYEIPAMGYLVIEDVFPKVKSESSTDGIITISATSKINVNVERIAYDTAHNFPLIPVSKWGMNYTVPSYRVNNLNKKMNYQNFIDITSLNDNTRISIKNSKGELKKNILLKSKTYFEYKSDEDLTGFTVTADKKIGVISGNQCLKISSYCDYVSVMLLDDSDLSIKYYNPGDNFFDIKKSMINRVVATKNKTELKINGKGVTTLSKGKFYEYRNSNPSSIEANFPVLAYYILDANYNAKRTSQRVDPSMVMLPSYNNGVKSAKFSFPQYMKYAKEIQIVIPTDKTDKLLLDNKSVKIDWKEFKNDPKISHGYIKFFDNDPHKLSVSDSITNFIPILLARGEDVSVATPIGIGFEKLFTEDISDGLDDGKETIRYSGSINLIDGKDFLSNPINLREGKVEITIFDNNKEDGDLISIFLDGKLLESNLKVLTKGEKLNLDLPKGETILTIQAENEGYIPPNTAGITFYDGYFKQTVIIDNKKGKSKSLKIIVN